MSLLITFRSELFKSTRTASFYLAIIGGLILPAIIILDVIFDGVSPKNQADIFNSLFNEGFKNTAFIFFPMFLVLISTLLPQLEFRNNTWKQVLASPQQKLNVFAAKFLNIHLLILVFLIAHNVFMLVAATVIHFADPSLDILNKPLDLNVILRNNLNTYVAVLAMTALQFWLGLRFRNFIIPLGIGLSLWFIGTLMVLEHDWNFARYFPHSLHIYGLVDKHKALAPATQLTSVIFAVVFLVLGFLDFRRREHKS